jgi:LAO/AO transport system kinase
MSAAPRVDDYIRGVREGNRGMLARAITLVESDRADHRRQAQEVLTGVLPQTGGAKRVGISGVPGAGKSTFIDALGTLLTSRGCSVAVLAVDPSSVVSGGSILGDKTRMPNLARDSGAYIRPSPSGGTLGGVASKTRESMLLCEASGFDVVLVETVGVGQSEAMVSDMVDFFLVLMLTGAGDELQGIKRGILEVADMVAINKADGDNRDRAEKARKDYALALKLMRGSGSEPPPVVTCSALEHTGIDSLWERLEERLRAMDDCGELEDKRRHQKVRWMWRTVEDQLMSQLRHAAGVRALVPSLESEVADGRIAAADAAERLLEAFRTGGQS